MAKVNAMLDRRMQKPSATSKMAAMAQQSASGHLTSFSGMFSVVELSLAEKERLAEILKKYGQVDQDTHQDLERLIALTAEVKAINHQAALLHGERIKKAHRILTSYRDGAFTHWLIATYGNRQTPYNLMQYYELYEALPKALRPQLERMPRQAIYALASRTGSLEQKQQFVEHYQDENKVETLALIRQLFPLNHADKRQLSFGARWLRQLRQLEGELQSPPAALTATEKQQALHRLSQIMQQVRAL